MTRKTHEVRTTLDLGGGLSVPLRIIAERGRRATIASVRQRAVYIRLPQRLKGTERAARIQEMVDWIRKTARDKPLVFAHLAAPPLAEGYTFELGDRQHTITVERHDLAHHKILTTGANELVVRLSTCGPAQEVTRVIPKLLAKHFAAQELERVARRVHELNAEHFQKRIRRVRLSDTYTRWGSCSTRGNINLATRLLLAPPEVLDAVIIHELAHLVEANHSPRFWAEVARVLPDYAVYDDWLRLHGNALRFDPVAME